MITTDDQVSLDWTAPMATVAQIDSVLTQFIEQRELPANLAEAIKYSLLGPGKRLRPILVIHSCAAVGGQTEMAMQPAAAIEMIHCFSLVHDDLPAMDDDDLRRGRPTLHRHTNEAMAILAGDAMVGLAFELMATRVSPELATALVRELAVATNDMISGQVYDTLGEFPVNTDPKSRLWAVHHHKTGALIRAACRIGAICGKADASQLAAINDFAKAIGLMFQIVDDLLDVTSTTEHLGKMAGKDADQGKLTYPQLYGVAGSRSEVERIRGAAIDALSIFGPSAEPLRTLCEYMSVRTK